MGEVKTNIVKAKIRGYIRTIKVLSKSVAEVTQPLQVKKEAINAEANKEDGSFKNVKSEIVELESISREYGILSTDIERYLFKISAMNSVLQDLGEEFEPDSDEDKGILNSAMEYAVDKNVFMYGNLNDERLVLNEDAFKHMNMEIDKLKTDDNYLEMFFNKAKYILSRNQQNG